MLALLNAFVLQAKLHDYFCFASKISVLLLCQRCLINWLDE